MSYPIIARRRLIDVQQRGEALRAAMIEQRRRFSGSMAWKSRAGRDYLYRRIGRIEQAHGPRSAETEAVHDAFVRGKAAAEERVRGLRVALEGMGAVNRAMRLGRVPRQVARVLRRLDEAGVPGGSGLRCWNERPVLSMRRGQVFVLGVIGWRPMTSISPLYARRNLRLASRMLPEGLLGLLRKVEPSIAPIHDRSYRAVNAQGPMVDLITPEPPDRMAVVASSKRRLGDGIGAEDVVAVEVPRLAMIVDGPRFTAIAIADDGPRTSYGVWLP